MRASLSVTVAALALATVSVSPVAIAAAVCTKEELHAPLKAGRPAKCAIQFEFDMCDDDCLAAKEKKLELSPKCSARADSAKTLYESAVEEIEECKKTRAEAKATYVPTVTVDIRECTDAEDTAWYHVYRFEPLPTECKEDKFMAKPGCSDRCLKALEKVILDSPPCWSKSYDVWNGEYQKAYLLACVKERGEDFANNTVMNTVVGADGKLKTLDAPATAAATKTPSSPTSTSSTAPSQSSVEDAKAPKSSDVRSARVVAGASIAGIVLVSVLLG